jgi:cellobiose phosphorylase
MLAHALYKRNFIKEGFEAINSIYQMAVNPRAKIYPMLPEYFNSEGRGLYLYLTGSASWYTYTLLDEVLGIKFILGDLHITPKLIPANFFGNSIAIDLKYQNKTLKITFIKNTVKPGPYGIKNLYLDENKITQMPEGYFIKKETLKKINKKSIAITAYLH